MYIRTKKIKKHVYAYLVKNRWTKKGARQKVSKYLGRVYTPERLKDSEFIDVPDEAKPSVLINSLISWVLADYGFTKARGIWHKDDLEVSIAQRKVRIGGKKAVLKVNNDYMCDLTLRKLAKFKSTKDRQGVGLDLAKAFISAGIPIPQDIFVQIFTKIYNEGQSYV